MQAIDGRQLKAGRVILGLTIREMAHLAGLHRNSVSRVEQVRNLPLSAYAADKIADVLNANGITFIISKESLGLCFEDLAIRQRSKYLKIICQTHNK